jgi:hypothetical protein
MLNRMEERAQLTLGVGWTKEPTQCQAHDRAFVVRPKRLFYNGQDRKP